MTTSKNNARTGDKTATARSRQHDAEVDYFNEHFSIDLRTIQTLHQHITSDEFCYLLGRCGMKKYFTPALLRVLGKANRRRDERLRTLLDYTLPELLTNIPVPVAAAFAERLRARLHKYDGLPELAPFVSWIVSEGDFYVLANRAIRADAVQSVREFSAIYEAGRDALLGGIRTGLANCRDLGADIDVDEISIGDTVSELEQRAWFRIWQNIRAWAEPGTASISTRLFAFGLDQAHGWKTERIRSKQRRGRLLGGVRRRRRELLYPTGAKKPSADAQNEPGFTRALN